MKVIIKIILLPADCDSYCKASKGKLKINMKKYCKKDYGELKSSFSSCSACLHVPPGPVRSGPRGAVELLRFTVEAFHWRLTRHTKDQTCWRVKSRIRTLWRTGAELSLRRPTSPTAAFLWAPARHAIQGVDKTYDLSPLLRPWLKSDCWTGQAERRHPAAYLSSLTDGPRALFCRDLGEWRGRA